MSPVAPVPEPDATLVSVVMPVYNAQATMVRSIDSVLAQTHRQLELILVDDGSRDGSAAIMDAYAARDARVVAVRQPNGGVAAARNRGLREARGTHVAFLDSDDWWEPEKLALQQLFHGASVAGECTARLFRRRHVDRRRQRFHVGDDRAAATHVGVDVDGDDIARTQRPADGNGDRIDERAVEPPAAVDQQRLEDAGQRV